MTPLEALAAAEAEDDAEFEAALTAQREALHALNATPADPYEGQDFDHVPQPVASDPECERCIWGHHICPGCGEPLHHGLEVCSGCLERLATEQAQAEAEARAHQAEVRRRQEARLAEALAKAGDLAEPEPPDVTAHILEAQRDLRAGRG